VPAEEECTISFIRMGDVLELRGVSVKTPWLMLLMFLILLLSFFSSSSTTGQYVRATEGKLGLGQTSGYGLSDSFSDAYHYYEVRDRNTYPSLVAVRNPFYGVERTVLGQRRTFTMALEEGTGDVDCDGDVDGDDLIYLNEALRRTDQYSLDPTFGKGLVGQFFSGVGNYRARYIGSKNICSLEAGDLNHNLRLDTQDYDLLYDYLYSGSELEGTFAGRDCGPAGNQWVNPLGEICTCVDVVGPSFVTPYTQEECTPVPRGFRAVQAGSGEVKLLPQRPQSSY